MRIGTLRNSGNVESKVITDFSLWLRMKYDEKYQKNSRYSLRAFAKCVGIDASTLSQYMSNKRRASRKAMGTICQKLNAHPDQVKVFLKKINLEDIDYDSSYEQLESDKFNFISEWYHIAILELSRTQNFSAYPGWIAKRLGITISEAKLATSRLFRLNLIEKNQNTFFKSHLNLTNFSTGVTSDAHKFYQKQIISKALSAVDGCSSNMKDITNISMAIDICKLDEARELITEFRKKMCAFLETGNQTEVL